MTSKKLITSLIVFETLIYIYITFEHAFTEVCWSGRNRVLQETQIASISQLKEMADGIVRSILSSKTFVAPLLSLAGYFVFKNFNYKHLNHIDVNWTTIILTESSLKCSPNDYPKSSSEHQILYQHQRCGRSCHSCNLCYRLEKYKSPSHLESEIETASEHLSHHESHPNRKQSRLITEIHNAELETL